MTRPDIDAIEARLKAATPGPWEVGRPVAGERYVGVHQRPKDWDGMGLQAVAAVRVSGPGKLVMVHDEKHLRGNADLIAHAPTDLAALLAYVRELEAEIAWHEDRSGTRAEQERQDAEWAADDAKVAAMSEDEIRASLEASGVRVDEAIRRSDVLIRVCIERAALSAQVDRLTAERDRLARTLACERGEWLPRDWHWTALVGGPCRGLGYRGTVTRNGSNTGWFWLVRLGYDDGKTGNAPTRLEAIEAAEAAWREK